MLADWGADVLKVEHPGAGDPSRNTAAWGVPARRPRRLAHIFEVGNRGKRAIGLDIATPEGREILMTSSSTASTCSSPTCCRRPAGSCGIEPDDIMGPQPAGRLRAGDRPGPARAARPARAASTASPTGAAPARRSAPPCPARSSRRRCPGPASATCSRAWRWPAASAPRCSSASAPGKGVVVDVSLMSAGLWAMGMTVSGASVLDVDELPHQGHFASPNPLTNVVPHQGRALHRPRLPPGRQVLARVLPDRRPAGVDRRRAVHDDGGPPGQRRGVRRACSTSCSPSARWPSGRRCSRARTASGTCSCRPGASATTSRCRPTSSPRRSSTTATARSCSSRRRPSSTAR